MVIFPVSCENMNIRIKQIDKYLFRCISANNFYILLSQIHYINGNKNYHENHNCEMVFQ